MQKLPATANSKIIDSWLLFCVVMIVVAIILHTVIGFLYKGSAEKGRNTLFTSIIEQARKESFYSQASCGDSTMMAAART